MRNVTPRQRKARRGHAASPEGHPHAAWRDRDPRTAPGRAAWCGFGGGQLRLPGQDLAERLPKVLTSMMAMKLCTVTAVKGSVATATHLVDNERVDGEDGVGDRRQTRRADIPAHGLNVGVLHGDRDM